MLSRGQLEVAKWDRKRNRIRSIDAQMGGYRDDCDGKVRYRDAEQAKDALRKIRSSPRFKMPTRFYRCHICNGFHLSSKDETS